MPFMVAGIAALAVAAMFIPAYVADLDGYGGRVLASKLGDPVLTLSVIAMALSLVSAILAGTNGGHEACDASRPLLF